MTKKCQMMNASKCHSSLFHCSNVRNPVTALHLAQDAAGSSLQSLDWRGCTAAMPPAKPKPTSHPVLPWNGPQAREEHQAKRTSPLLLQA